jgi:hypothetical protein
MNNESLAIDSRHGYDDISQDQASAMLRLGLPGPRNAADDLVNHLESADGAAWMRGLFESEPFSLLKVTSAQILGARMTLESISMLKDRGKEMVKRPQTRSAYLAGLAAYYLAIAAALRDHKTVITRTPRPELNQILIELASVTQEQWKELFMQAAAVPAGG